MFVLKKIPGRIGDLKRPQRKSNKSVYLRLLYSYIFITIFTVLLITFVLYSIFSFNSVQEISSITVKMMSQTRYSADFIWNWASAYGYSLYYDNTISQALYTDDFDKLLQASVDRKLTSAVTSNPLIDSIYVYNGYSKRFISSVTSVLDENEFFDQEIVSFLEESGTIKDLDFVPRKAVFKLYNSSFAHNYITLIISRKNNSNSRLTGALIINISVEKFDEFVQSMNQEKNSTFFIVNKDGNVISHTDAANFLSDFSKKDHIVSIMRSGRYEDSFVSVVDGEKSVVSFVYLKRLGWWFVSVIPYSVALGNVTGTRNTMMLIALLILLVLIAVDFLVTKKLFSPVRELVKRVHRIEGPSSVPGEDESHNGDLDYLSRAFSNIIKRADSLEKKTWTNASFIKNEMLKNMLLNDHALLRNVKDNFEDLDISMYEPGFTVIILSIDGYTSLKEEHAEESIALFRFSINNIASELIGKTFSNEGVDMGSDHVAVIVSLNSSEEDLPAELEQICNEIIAALKKHLELPVTASIGSYTDTLDSISKSYRSARQLMKYRIVYGFGSVLTHNILSTDSDEKSMYPDNIDKRIMDNLRLRNLSKAEAAMDNFIEEVRRYPYNDIVLSFIQLANSSIRVLSQLSSGQEDFMEELRNVLNVIESSDNIDDIRNWFINIYGNAISYLDNVRSTHKENTVSTIQKYIEDNFSDPMLSIDSIAETVNLSSNYLRIIFKEITGITVLEYINKKRFDLALDLLTTTGHTNSKIAEMTGFNSATYFYTAFKKRFGMTPDNYRKKEK